MDHDELLMPTIIFEPPAPSPNRHRRRHRPGRGHGHHHRHGRSHRDAAPISFQAGWGTDSTTDYSSSVDTDMYSSNDDDDNTYHHPRRHLHRHIHLPPAGPPPGVPNAFSRRRPPVAAAAAAVAPRTYGYRRLHYQGGQQERRRWQTTTPTTPCHATAARGRCGARSPRRNILVRCGRWLFGESGRCCCALATGCCDGEQSPSSSIPTRHHEEEYWGPGTQDWAYGPPGHSANWHDTSWSGGGNGGANPYNLAPGGVIEEVEEGGTLPATAAITAAADPTHDHCDIGANGRGQRPSRRSRVRSYMRDHGVLGLVDRERDRELDRNMVDRQTADRERDRELDRNMMDREIAKQRDHQLLMLLDRERDPHRHREKKGTMELLEQKLGQRRRELQSETRTRTRSKRRLKAREESNSEVEQGLRAEMEALRNDFRKLMRDTSNTRGTAGTRLAQQGFSAVSSVASRSSGRQELSADIQRTIDQEDEKDEDENDSASSSRNL